ncbi:MAG: COX15/CtaA family protein, partial [Pseudomonadota bacterium]|nr:COX15/CtaA family protein [Pseudomonadota bacterium]
CAVMVLLMAIIGAMTRLTGSGLSMVEWRPYTGMLPPLDHAEWERVFALYRNTPEFRLKNMHMDLAGFQQIFFLEWLHRLWGQLASLVYAVPFLWFMTRCRIPGRLKLWLAALLALGGLQGLMGWYMVKSGLADRPDVSHFRLAAHLLLALALFAGLVWTAMDVRPGAPALPASPPKAPLPRRHGWLCLGLVVLTIAWGAFVAGLDAGFAWNTFPLMGGHWLAPEALAGNILENRAMVQFTHRWLAILAALVTLAWAWRVSAIPALRPAAIVLKTAVLVQVALGISTLIMAVPVSLATAHQAGAFIVVAMLVRTLHGLQTVSLTCPAEPAVARQVPGTPVAPKLRSSEGGRSTGPECTSGT